MILFIGFALMAGGLAGSVVSTTFCATFCDFVINTLTLQTVLVLKYVLNGYPEQFVYYGYANVSQSVALMLSAVVLWISQSTSSEYEYNLTL